MALAVLAPFVFGNAGISIMDGPGRIMDGPGRHSFDAGLTKNSYVTEARYLNFAGKMFSAGAARQMQFGLKFVFDMG